MGQASKRISTAPFLYMTPPPIKRAKTHAKRHEVPLKVCQTTRQAARLLRKLECLVHAGGLFAAPAWRRISLSPRPDEDTRAMLPLSASGHFGAKLAEAQGLAERLSSVMGFQLIEAVVIDSGGRPQQQLLHKDAPMKDLGYSRRKGWRLRAFLFPLFEGGSSLVTRAGEVQIGPSQHAVFCPVGTPHAGSTRGGTRLHVVCAQRVGGTRATMAFQTLKRRYIRCSKHVELLP